MTWLAGKRMPLPDTAGRFRGVGSWASTHGRKPKVLPSADDLRMAANIVLDALHRHERGQEPTIVQAEIQCHAMRVVDDRQLRRRRINRCRENALR